jgi:hypothetical protein
MIIYLLSLFITSCHQQKMKSLDQLSSRYCGETSISISLPQFQLILTTIYCCQAISFSINTICFYLPKKISNCSCKHGAQLPLSHADQHQHAITSSFTHSQVSPYNFSQRTKKACNPLWRFSWRNHSCTIASSTFFCACRKCSLGRLLMQFVDVSI